MNNNSWRTPVGRLVNHQNNRAARCGAVGSFTLEEWLALCERHGNCCACCGVAKPLSIDHIIALSRGGGNSIDNIQPLCFQCNSQKQEDSILEAGRRQPVGISINMVRLDKLDAVSKAVGLSRSEAIRMAIDLWLATVAVERGDS